MKTIIHYGMSLFYIIRETVAILPNPGYNLTAIMHETIAFPYGNETEKRKL